MHEKGHAMTVDALKEKVTHQIRENELWDGRGTWGYYVDFEGKGVVTLDGTFHLVELRAIVAALETEAREASLSVR